MPCAFPFEQSPSLSEKDGHSADSLHFVQWEPDWIAPQLSFRMELHLSFALLAGYYCVVLVFAVWDMQLNVSSTAASA